MFMIRLFFSYTKLYVHVLVINQVLQFEFDAVSSISRTQVVLRIICSTGIIWYSISSILCALLRVPNQLVYDLEPADVYAFIHGRCQDTCVRG